MLWTNFKQRFAASFHALELERFGSDLERMRAILDAEFDNLSAVQLPDVGSEKSGAHFTRWKTHGNDLLADGRSSEACEAYTRALFFAPGPEEAAVAFGNRSAALIRLGFARDCLRDVAAALASDFPADKRFRLLIRRGECLLQMGEPQAAKAHLREALLQLDGRREPAWLRRAEEQLARCEEPPLVSSSTRELRCDRPPAPAAAGAPSTKLPSASCAVEVRTSGMDGRGLYASRRVELGEVLVVERPYAACLVSERFLTHCYCCAMRCLTLRPCRACSHVGFCSADCEERAWVASHRFECPAMSLVAQLPNLRMVRLALRTLLRTDPAEVRRVVSDAASAWSDGEASAQFEDLFPDSFESGDYAAAFSIVGNSGARSSCDLTDRALMAMFLMLCAARAGYVGIPLSRGDAEVVGAALLRHLQSLPCNAHEITEQVVPAGGELSEASLEELASGLFPVLSLVNHSCDPNVHRVCYDGLTCVLRSLRPLEAGEQLLDCYSQHFAVQPKAERRSALSEQYFFECRCKACEEDWPLYQGLCDIVYPSLRVRELSREDAKAWEKFSKRLEHVMGLLGQGREAFCENDEAERFFMKFQAFLHRVVQRPWKELNNNEECLKILWNLKGNCFQAFA